MRARASGAPRAPVVLLHRLDPPLELDQLDQRRARRSSRSPSASASFAARRPPRRRLLRRAAGLRPSTESIFIRERRPPERLELGGRLAGSLEAHRGALPLPAAARSSRPPPARWPRPPGVIRSASGARATRRLPPGSGANRASFERACNAVKTSGACAGGQRIRGSGRDFVRARLSVARHLFRRRRLDLRRGARRSRRRRAWEQPRRLWTAQLQRLQFRPDIHGACFSAVARVARQPRPRPARFAASSARSRPSASSFTAARASTSVAASDASFCAASGGASRRGGAVLARRRGLLLELRNSRLGSGRASLEPLTHRLHFLELGFQRRDLDFAVSSSARVAASKGPKPFSTFSGVLSCRRARFPASGPLAFSASSRRNALSAPLLRLPARARSVRCAPPRARSSRSVIGAGGAPRCRRRRRRAAARTGGGLSVSASLDFPFHLVQRLRPAGFRRTMRFECHRLGRLSRVERTVSSGALGGGVSRRQPAASR